MRIAFVHIGPPKGGIRRYGQMLAAEARGRDDLTVTEVDINLTGQPTEDAPQIKRVASTLHGQSIVHIQYSKKVWGGGRQHGHNLDVFFDACPAPVVATLHDVYFDERKLRPPTVSTGRDHVFARVIGACRRRIGMYLDRDRPVVRKLLTRAQMAFVASSEELRRLSTVVDTSPVRVVPHFVEQRTASISPLEARGQLDLGGKTVLTVLGFLVPRKGYRLVIEAMRHMPSDVYALFAGGPTDGGEAYEQVLRRQIDQAGLAERIRITGFVDEPKLQLCLAATHVALCPFESLSASGSLATWISGGRPIVASALPQFEEFDSIEPGAVRIFKPHTVDALVRVVRDTLDHTTDAPDAAVCRLAEKLAMPRVMDMHLRHYEEAICHDDITRGV